MNLELFKVEVGRGIATLMPYAKAHKMKPKNHIDEFQKYKKPAPERHYDFPPYHLILTIEALGPEHGLSGATIDCPLMSVSAPMRPVKVLNDEEKEVVREIFMGWFPDHNIMDTRSFVRGTAAFKVMAIPKEAPTEVEDVLKVVLGT